MKLKTLIAIFILAGIVACKEHSHDKGDHHGAAATELKLNMGKKWQADSITRITYALLDKEAASAKISDAASARKFTERSEKLIAGLIKGCTMTGDAHDQLHILIGKTNTALDNLKNAEAGHFEHRLTELRATTALFAQYFE